MCSCNYFQSFFLRLSVFILTASYSSNAQKCKKTVDIAIVGAGITGSYAAYRLRNTGKKIHLYEYNDRIGGRTFTYRLPDAPDINADLGGVRYIEDGHPILHSLVEELGLTSTHFTEEFGRDGRTWWYLRNQWIPQKQLRFGDIPYNLTPGEKKNQNRIFAYLMERLTGLTGTFRDAEVHTAKLKPEFGGTPLYELTLMEALKMVASEDGIQFTRDRENFHGEVDEDVAATNLFSTELGELEETTGEVLTVAEGYDAVAKKLANIFEKKKSNKVFLNSELLSISKAKKKELVLKIKNRKSQKRFDVCAKRVILAVPKYALSKISYKPLKAPEYQYAMEGFKMIESVKIFMTFDYPWWLSGVNCGTKHAYVTRSDILYSQSYDFKISKVTGKAVLMVSYADGIDAVKLHKLQSVGPPIEGTAGGEMRVTTALRDRLLAELSAAYNISVSEIPPIRSSVAMFWQNPPFGGAWAVKRVGYHQIDIQNRILRPSLMDEVFVIGADFNLGFNGVPWIESGLEVADQVLKRYNFI